MFQNLIELISIKIIIIYNYNFAIKNIIFLEKYKFYKCLSLKNNFKRLAIPCFQSADQNLVLLKFHSFIYRKWSSYVTVGIC